MANYFSGKSGRLVIDGFADDVFKISTWSYVSDKSLVEISNSLSFGKEQYIANLTSGNITAEGFMTNTLLDTVFDGTSLVQGQEVLFNLYFDYANTLGFTNIEAILDEFDFSMDNDGTGKFKITALLSEPKI